MEIVYEDENLIVINKKSGTPIQRDKSKDESLLEQVENYCVGFEVGIVHRLDRPVGGLVVFSKDKTTLVGLNKQFINKEVKKNYTAIVCGEEEDKILTDYLFKNQRLNITKIVNKNSMSAKESILEYKNIDKVTVDDQIYSKFEINLRTGRHHQIRVQLANNNTPIYGDRKYNKDFNKKRGNFDLGLFANKLEFNHPIKRKKMKFEIKLPSVKPFTFFK